MQDDVVVAELDVALLMLVLHHLPEPKRALVESARTLRPGGRLLILDMLPHEREEYRQKMVLLERQAEEEAALREVRARLQPNDPVRVQRFDKPGRIVRVDHKRNVALVSLGLGQWEVPLDEVFPLQE